MLAGANALAATFTGNAAFQSLGVLSNAFPHYSAQLRAATRALAIGSPRAITALFPVDVLGKTFAWDTTSHAYAIVNAAGAPSAGVRFLLYTADPSSGLPAAPLAQLGSVDLTDASTPQQNQLGVVLRLGAATVAQYDIADVTATTSHQVTLHGWIAASDGTGRISFDLTHLTTFADTTLDRHYALVSPAGTAIDYTLQATPAGSGTSTFRLTRGHASIEFATSFTAGADSGLVRFDGVPVARVQGAVAPVFTATNGFALKDRQLQDLTVLFALDQGLGTMISGLFGPAFTVFSGI